MRERMRGKFKKSDTLSFSITQEGPICGYASVFHVRDLQDEIILPGAFLKSIQKFNEEASVKMYLHHDPWKEIGVWHKIEEDDHGLWVEGTLNLSCAEGMMAHHLREVGELNSLSIGFVEGKWENTKVNKTRIKMIHTLTLFEISLVFRPANPLAKIAGEM